MHHDAAELSRGLARRVVQLAAELLPHGRRDGQEWRCGSTAGEPGASLAVHLSGERAGVWADFASGETGDALDLVAAVRFAGNRRDAMDWARGWLGTSRRTEAPGQARRAASVPPDSTREAGPDAEALARRRAALALFLSAAPSLAGTPVALYLAGRGIDLAQLGRQPRCLRFAPALPNRESGRNWPAMVAAITGDDGAHIATHRTWLARAASGSWGKAPLKDPKMTLGTYAGGCIRLWRGASGKPLSDAPKGDVVAIGEGIETCLSVVVACPELRVLCAVSIANMIRVRLPAAIGEVIVLADNDRDGSAASRALARAVAHYAEGGRTVRIARSPAGKDFNDLLRAGVAS